MKGSVFLDTNILVYLYSTTEPQKRSKSISVMTDYFCTTSTQALNEFNNVFIKKYKMPNDFIIVV
jgi:predicted nucleic acid-binding protein